MSKTMKRVTSWVATCAILMMWVGILGVVVLDNKVQLKARYQKLTAEPPTIVSFDVVLNSIPEGTQRGSLYFDTGRGFNPAEVVVFTYPLIVGKPKHYQIKMPSVRPIRRLRFDPLDGKGEVSIKNMTVKKYREKNVLFVENDLNGAKNDSISKIVVQGSTLTITSIGGDPYFVLINDFSPYQQK